MDRSGTPSSLCFLLSVDRATAASRVEPPASLSRLRRFHGTAGQAYKKGFALAPLLLSVEQLLSRPSPVIPEVSIPLKVVLPLLLNRLESPRPYSSRHLSTCVDNNHRMAQSLSPDNPHHDCRHLFYSRLHRLSGRGQRRRSRSIKAALSASSRYVTLRDSVTLSASPQPPSKLRYVTSRERKSESPWRENEHLADLSSPQLQIRCRLRRSVLRRSLFATTQAPRLSNLTALHSVSPRRMNTRPSAPVAVRVLIVGLSPSSLSEAQATSPRSSPMSPSDRSRSGRTSRMLVRL